MPDLKNIFVLKFYLKRKSYIDLFGSSLGEKYFMQTHSEGAFICLHSRILSWLNYPRLQKKISYIVEFRTPCQTFFCKAQVAGWQISTPQTLSTTSLNGVGIWHQHLDAQIKKKFGTGAPLSARGLQKVQKICKNCFSVNS